MVPISRAVLANIRKKWQFESLHAKLEDDLEIASDDRRTGLRCDHRCAAEFYVVRDSTTKKCTVVDTKPTTTTTTIVNNGTYKTKTEAESGMKTTKVCSE